MNVPPVSAEETLELYAFMEAADESKRRDGAEVSVPEIPAKARGESLISTGFGTIFGPAVVLH